MRSLSRIYFDKKKSQRGLGTNCPHPRLSQVVSGNLFNDLALWSQQFKNWAWLAKLSQGCYSSILGVLGAAGLLLVHLDDIILRHVKSEMKKLENQVNPWMTIYQQSSEEWGSIPTCSISSALGVSSSLMRLPSKRKRRLVTGTPTLCKYYYDQTITMLQVTIICCQRILQTVNEFGAMIFWWYFSLTLSL